MARKPAVLFVCLGNICRSPLAEAAFKAEAARIGGAAPIALFALTCLGGVALAFALLRGSGGVVARTDQHTGDPRA